MSILLLLLAALGGLSEPPAARRADGDRTPRIQWRESTALGAPTAGGLRRGVRLPAGGAHLATWDPVLRRRPNRAWRRWGTDRLVRLTLRAARAQHRAGGPRLLVGDLSRRRGGDFGVRYGAPGHASHQNGLDADLYYPRRDRRLVPPADPGQIDRRRGQRLVDRFVRAGADKVFVGPRTGLTGPPGVVQAIPHHDDHLHVRLRPVRVR